MIYPLFILRQDMRPCDRLQDACFLQLPDGLAGVVILADGRPTRADRIKDIKLVKVQRRHFLRRKVRVRKGQAGLVEAVVFQSLIPLSSLPDSCFHTLGLSPTVLARNIVEWLNQIWSIILA